jgi:hypothetical protein
MHVLLALTLTLAFILISALGPTVLNAQQTPKLTGAIDIDLPNGLIAGDVCLHNPPAKGDTVWVVLNRVLSIERMTGVFDLPADFFLEPGGEAIRYRLMRRSEAGADSVDRVNEPVCMEYSGAAPVFDVAAGDYRAQDLSALIAFNGISVRARGASRWYPVTVDNLSGLVDDAIAFDLDVSCAACETIYLNGIPPASGPRGSFSSVEPRELLLVAGKLPVQYSGDMVILGEVVPEDSAAMFIATLSEIQRFYERFLGIPYGRPPDIVRLDAIREPRTGQVWGFFSDPALVLIGMRISRFVEVLAGSAASSRRNVYSFLSHELAHRFFGWSLGSRSSRRDLFGEPFATYLELKALREKFGEEDYENAVRSLRNRVLRGNDRPAFDVALPVELGQEGYRYGFAPLQLLALEQTIGEPTMRDFLRALLTAPAEARANANLDFLRATALEVGVAPADWEQWEANCMRASLETNSCLSSVGR